MYRLRILIISPTTKSKLKPKEEILKKLASNETEVKIIRLDMGPETIESTYDGILAAPDLLIKVKEAEEGGFDAVVNTCFIDPAIHASREVVDIPVIATGEASMLLAASLGEQFSVITLDDCSISIIRRNARILGVDSKLASVRALNISVSNLGKDLEKTKKIFLGEAEKCVKLDGANVIVPGCGFFTILTNELQKEMGVPIINPNGAALKLAETIVKLGLKHARKCV